MSTKKDLLRKKKKLGGDELRVALLKDDAFKKYRILVKNTRERFDLDAMLEEANTLHKGRPSRNLKGTNPGTQRISDSALTDGSYRSRMVEMYCRLGTACDLLDITIKAAKTHIASSYGDDIPTFRTKVERSAFLDTYVTSGVELMAKMESIRRVLENYIKDIDQTHFQLKLSFQALALTHDKNKEM
jgi:hypothetical protein